MNLVINAKEAIGAGSGTIRVSTAGGIGRKETVVLAVQDTGAGMNAETRSKIFDPFFSTKFLGRGLGLAAVQGIVRVHNATICVDTALGKGTTFRIAFPSANQVGDVAAKVSAPMRGSETVLVVDDAQAVSRFIKVSLERYGYTVILASNGPSAIKILTRKDRKIDFLLLDISMPEMSGAETGQRIRQIAPVLPICYMSGYNEEMVLKRIPGADTAHCFLRKPFTPEQVATKIRAMLGDVPRTN